MKAKILITDQTEKGSGFATVIEGQHVGEVVFIAGKTMKASETSVGDTVMAELVPNRPEMKSEVPWFSPFIQRDDASQVDVEAVRAALSAFDYPVTAEDAGIELPALYAAHSEAQVVKVVAYQSPTAKPVVMWAASMEVV